MNTMIKDLYKSYKQDIYVYLISLTHSQNIAEELTSEVFVSAIKSLPNFQGNADIKTWLFSIARYKWYEYLRREKREITIYERLESYIQGNEELTEDKVLKSEIVARIIMLLEEEKEQTKSIVLMRVEGYSFYEIAKEFSISENSARVLDFRIRKKLKEILIKEGLIYE